MPCYLTGSREGDLALDAAETSKEVTKLTRMLCRVCKQAEGLKTFNRLPEEVQKWWKKHKKVDEQRKKEEGQ